jgi:hypothetical protein
MELDMRFNGVSTRVFIGLLVAGILQAKDIPVAPGGDVQAAIDAAGAGDSIILTAGATYTGSLVLRNKGTLNAVITIRSSYNSFRDGVRVGPADASKMARLVAAGASLQTFETEHGANHYRLSGLEIVPAAGSYAWDIVRIGLGDETVDADLPSGITLDHVYIHADPAVGSKRAVAVNGKNLTIADSYIADIFSTSQDAQAICGWNGPGPITISNNYLEASGEVILFGGAIATMPNLVPSNIRILGNYLHKPDAWKAQPSYVIKNLVELKNAENVLLEGNVLDNNWGPLHFGTAIVMGPRSEGVMPWVRVANIRFRYNIVRNADRILAAAGADSQTGQGYAQDIVFEHNLFENISGFGMLLMGPNGVVIDHNTILAARAFLAADGSPATGFRFTNNIAQYGQSGVFGSGILNGLSALNAYFPGWTFTNNVLFDGQTEASLYPPGNFFPSLAAVGFVDAAAHDYRLGASSPYLTSGTDGKPLGGDMATINAMAAIAIGGFTNSSAPATGMTVSVPAATSPLGAILVTWTADGTRKAKDWVGLYAVGGCGMCYLAVAYTGGTATGSVVFNAPPATGQYEVRYFLNDSLTVAATSSPITVAAGANGDLAGFTVTAPASVAAGAPAVVSWTAGSLRGTRDWLALYPVGGCSTCYVWTSYTGGAATGSLTLTAPAMAGQYEFRYLLNDGFTTVASSAAMTVGAVNPNPNTGFSVTAPASAVGGSSVVVDWTAGSTRTTNDVVGLFPVGACATCSVWSGNPGGAANGSAALNAPAAAGQYEFRYLLNGTTLVATSAAMTVTAAVVNTPPATGMTLSVPAATSPLGAILVAWTADGTRKAKDWVGLYAVGGCGMCYLAVAYTGGTATGSVVFNAPPATGQYEVRYFLNDSLTVAATSAPITVAAGANGNLAGFTVTAPASVAVGAAAVVSWTAGSLRGTRDWLALYPVGGCSTCYVWASYTGGTAAGSLTVTAPAAAGQYEFRYLLNDGFTTVASSAAMTVGAVNPNPNTGFSVTAPASAVGGGSVVVNWTAGSTRTANDVIGLFPVGACATCSVWSGNPGGAANGSAALNAPAAAGQYEFRYLLNGTTLVATGAAMTVTAAAVNTPPATGMTLSVPAATSPQGAILVAWTADSTRKAKDWVGLYAVGGCGMCYLAVAYTGGTATGSVVFNAPPAAGQYEVRYFLNDSLTVAATSAPITVAAGANGNLAGFTLTAPGSVAAGAPAVVSWTAGSLRGTRDWLALYPVGGCSTCYVWASYTGGTATGSLTVTAPAMAGQYEFRYMLNDGLTAVAFSAPMTVH